MDKNKETMGEFSEETEDIVNAEDLGKISGGRAPENETPEERQLRLAMKHDREVRQWMRR